MGPLFPWVIVSRRRENKTSHPDVWDQPRIETCFGREPWDRMAWSAIFFKSLHFFEGLLIARGTEEAQKIEKEIDEIEIEDEGAENRSALHSLVI